MDNYKAASLKGSFYKVYKICLILLLYIIIRRLEVSVFKEFELSIVVNIVYRCDVDSLSPFFLTFADLLADICHTV